MQCCLGVKARDTGRAAKIEAFIKTGCSHAVAAVTLWNTGHDAFMPTVYGSQITIERRITKTSSTFAIKDQAKRKVKATSCHALVMRHASSNAAHLSFGCVATLLWCISLRTMRAAAHYKHL